MAENKCSFCSTEDDERKYLVSDDRVATVCSNCALMFAEYMVNSNVQETSDEEVMDIEEDLISEDVGPRIILSLGFIPVDWACASDGGKQIMVGDTDHSRTFEYEYEINDDGFVNLTTGKALGGSMADIYKQLGADSIDLSNGHDRIANVILKNIYEICLDETDELDSYIAIHEDGISDFTNNRKKYNGCFYCRYIVEEDDNIEKELLFVIKPK